MRRGLDVGVFVAAFVLKIVLVLCAGGVLLASENVGFDGPSGGGFTVGAPVSKLPRVPVFDYNAAVGSSQPTNNLRYSVATAAFVTFAGHPNPGTTFYMYAIWIGPTADKATAIYTSLVRQDSWGGAWKQVQAMVPAGWYYDVVATDDNGGGTSSSQRIWSEQALQ